MRVISNRIVDGATVTPDDDTVVEFTGVRMGDAAAGDIAVRFSGVGTSLTFTNVQPGEIIYGSVDRVLATGTTATLIQGLQVR